MDVLQQLVTEANTKLVLLVMDGLGGLPHPDTGKTELETARTPNLDRLARSSSVGLHTPVAPGITPGSGPGHLGLFGYDPVQHEVGRGVLSALGVGIELKPEDVACRVNFATMENGVITDRRAGRIPTEECARLCKKLESIRIPGVQIIIQPEMQYRAVIVFRGEGLGADLTDTDPQKTGLAPLPVRARSDDPASRRTAELFNEFVRQANMVLAEERPANTILLRGFDRLPKLATFREKYGLNSAVIAVYPMYRGLARLVGMEVLTPGHSIEEEFEVLENNWEKYDFFFVHVKPTDSAGEDGAFDRKVQVIEEVDALIPRIEALNPDVLVVTGDHSTPAVLKAHSWHPVPILLVSRYARRNAWVEKFGESDCARGALGFIKSTDILPLMLAHGLRLQKFGA
ncbi:MAG: 2,3-bisphosphoglycerate-independent phosphoglycerate mutase [Limnochordales bacterium]|nr:2,3-bisphosphoglycerate-independent phosphoglycerate mutase [Limnochordales bacterium]